MLNSILFDVIAVVIEFVVVVVVNIEVIAEWDCTFTKLNDDGHDDLKSKS